MKLRVINPNTSDKMTSQILRAAELAASPGTEISCSKLMDGPELACSASDIAIASYHLLQKLKEDEGSGEYDAYVIASFADPALDALKELTGKPVIGIAEAAFHFSAFLGYKFAVIGGIPKMEKLFQANIASSGAKERLAGIVELPKDIMNGLGTTGSYDTIENFVRKVLRENEAEVIVLAGGMLSEYAERLSQRLAIPVIDGIKCAVKIAESLVQLKLNISRVNTYAPPRPLIF